MIQSKSPLKSTERIFFLMKDKKSSKKKHISCSRLTHSDPSHLITPKTKSKTTLTTKELSNDKFPSEKCIKKKF